ncbi:MAG: FAD-dependent oxidoreductase [Pseudomonadota bacterium]
MSDKKTSKGKNGLVSRRQVLTSGGVAIASGALAALAGPGILAAGTAPKENKVKTNKGNNNVPLDEQVWDFEKRPDPIPDSRIVETHTADIVIIGTGASGMPCAVAALETGLKVIAIEKLSKAETFTPGRPDLGRAIGAWYGFSGSRLYKKKGIKLDKEQLAGAQIRSALWRCDQKQVQRIVKYGEKVADWWLDILEEQGVNVDAIPIETHAEMNQQELPAQAQARPGQYFYWHPVGHVIPCAQVEAALERYLNDNGFEITYETPARQLIRKGDRITGVIAQNKKGYVKYNARKAVIICSGGYEGNKEMIRKYIPESSTYATVVGKKTNTGDGYLMAQWIGARMDPWPHCPMTWDGMNPEALEKYKMDYIGVARQAWLYVNAFGERFMNENTLFAGVARSIYMQPRSMMWSVFDERWRDDDVQEKLAGTVCRRMTTRRLPFILPMNTKETTEKLIAAGIILKADTLDALAAKMKMEGPSLGIGSDLDADTFKATVKRYNELAASGHDSDFGKDPQMLFPCDKPPFYAVRTTLGILVTMAGPMVNEYFQVIDKQGRIIPGLYAVGNCSGGFNSYEFSMDADIGSLGRCCVSGYLAAKHAAGVSVEIKALKS